MLVLLYDIFLNINDTCDRKNTIVIPAYFIVCDQEFFTIGQKKTISSAVFNNVVVQVIANIIRPFDDNITF